MLKTKWTALLMCLLCLCVLANGSYAQSEEQAWAESVTEQCLAEAQKTQALTLAGPLEDYLRQQTRGTLRDGAVAYQVALPDVTALKAKDLPAYKGEEPAVYLADFAQGVAAQVAALPQGTTHAVTFTTANAEAGITELTQIFTELARSYENWLAGAMGDTKAYGAMTRLLLDRGQGAEVWKKVDVAEDNQRPIFAKERREMERGDTGDTVRAVQQALIAAGYMEGKVDGKYGKGTQTAVQAFEQARGFEVDGKLSASEQRVLLGEPEPVSIAQYALSAAGVSEEAGLDWSQYLLSLQGIAWRGGTLSYHTPDYTYAEYDLLEAVIADYNTGEYGTCVFQERIVSHAQTLPVLEVLRTVSLQCTLQPFLQGGDATGVVNEAALHTLAGGYADYAQPIANILVEANAYALANLPPVPFPGSGVLQKFPSGGSRFVIQNGNDVPLYAKVYQSYSMDDLSAEILVGTMFISANSTASTKIKPGYYHVHYGTGDTWYGEEAMFGDEGWYHCCDGSYLFEKNYEHTLMIQISSEGGEGTTFSPISPGGM